MPVRAASLVSILLAAISLVPPPAHLARIAVVPLDDRPAGLQAAQLAGAIADAEVVGPPKYRLGHFTAEGDADGIAEWLDGLDLATIDAVIVSTDMLAYGGQIASRRPSPSQEKALRRIAALGRLKARRKDVRVYAYSTLLPLSPPEDGRKGKWRETIVQWAELGGSNAKDPKAAAEAQQLEAEIPPPMIELYRTVRARNLAVTAAALDLVSKGAVNDLALVATSSTPRGIAGAEQDDLTARAASQGVAARVQVVADADPLGLLLLGRAVGDITGVHPGVVVESGVPSVTPVAESLVQVAGSALAKQAGPRDLTWLVSGAPTDEAGARKVVDQAASLVSAGRRVAMADVASGEATGASVPLVEALRNRHLFTRLASYAGGPAPASLASSLVEGLLRVSAVTRTPPPDAALQSRLDDAQIIAVLHHLVVDFAYQAVIRPQAVTDYLAAHAMNPSALDADQATRVEAYLTGEVKPLAENLVGDLDDQPMPSRGPRRAATKRFRNLEDFKLRLPWGRLDDVEISFVLK
jgi:uncharacterized protein DUF4127